MQQRQLRLGDILDDYCPRERRLTNHAVVAMIGEDVKQTRCTTCDAEHEYKHAKVPAAAPEADTPAALYAQVLAGGPKRVVHEPAPDRTREPSATPQSNGDRPSDAAGGTDRRSACRPLPARDRRRTPDDDVRRSTTTNATSDGNVEEGPVHRRLIRATLAAARRAAAADAAGARLHDPSAEQAARADSAPSARSAAAVAISGQPIRQRGGRRHAAAGRRTSADDVAPAGKRHGPGRKRSK